MSANLANVTLSIIVVSWNTRDLLADCLASVYAQPPTASYEVWVVDNASADGSADMVRERFPQVKLIVNEANVGFAQANNLAIKQCGGKYVLLLNPDTVVLPDALNALVFFLDARPEAAAAGSRLLNPGGSLQTSCYPAPTLWREWWFLLHLDALRDYGRYPMHTWDTDKPRPVDVLQGASLLLRKSVLDQIGFMDGDYFMYSEEVDLCRRIQRAGWRLYWVPQSQVVHYGGQSTKQMAGEMFLQLYLGKLKYFRKHNGRSAGHIYKIILLKAALIRLALTPLLFFKPSEERQRGLTLARHYWRLLRELPEM
jgi:N-acetylglucosaminyl-diphospho-decaprenol L-rhamnosyltransferase